MKYIVSVSALLLLHSLCFAQNECLQNIQINDTIVLSDGLGRTYSYPKEQYNPMKMCWDYIALAPNDFKYWWFESCLIDTISLDTLVYPILSHKKNYFACEYFSSVPAYLVFRQLFDPNLEMEAVRAVSYIQDNYKDKGLIANFYFKHSDSSVSKVTRKYIYQTEENCDFYVTGIFDEEKQAEELSIYPNPSNDGLFYFSEMSQLPESINVYSAQGAKQSVQLTNNSLDLSILPKGVYLVDYMENGKTVKRKLMTN